MATHLRLPTVVIAALSIVLNIAILSTAAHPLSVFNSSRTDNVYFLPIWGSHFDMRGLAALIGTSTVIIVLNAVLVGALFVAALPANGVILTSSALSTILSLIGLAFPAHLNSSAPGRATLQTWTCTWSAIPNQEVPTSFSTLCQETRFAFYTTIPNLLLQLCLVGIASYALTSHSASAAQKRRSLLRLHEAAGEKFDLELAERRQAQKMSIDSKSSSPNGKVRVVEVGKQ